MPDMTILFVEGELNILQTLQRLFQEEDYTVVTAQSGTDALALIEEGCRPRVVVSGQQMPGMSGAQFLGEVRKKLPESIRIMLIGHADIGAAADAINLGDVFCYILKPWEDENLKLSIREAVSRFELVAENNRLSKDMCVVNRQFEDLNAILEQQVEERTRELRKTNEENQRLTVELQARVRELQAWDRIQHHLMSFHSMEETLQLIVDVVREASRADAVRILLADGHGAFELAASSLSGERQGIGREEKTPATWLLPYLEEVSASKKPMRLAADELGELQAGAGSICLAPILRNERQLGILETVTVEGDAEDNEEQLQILANFALQAGVAIQDARLHSSLDDLGSSLDRILIDLGSLG